MPVLTQTCSLYSYKFASYRHRYADKFFIIVLLKKEEKI